MWKQKQLSLAPICLGLRDKRVKHQILQKIFNLGFGSQAAICFLFLFLFLLGCLFVCLFVCLFCFVLFWFVFFLVFSPYALGLGLGCFDPFTGAQYLKGNISEVDHFCLKFALIFQEPPKSKKVQHSNSKNAVLFEAINLIIHHDR